MTSRIDVSIENRGPAEPEGEGKKHPNTCPRCHSHYRDDELAATLRVCPQCGYHFPVRARERVEQLADGGTFVEEEHGRREVHARLRARRGPARAARVRDRLGRRAHAGGDSLAHAASEDRLRRGRSPGGAL